MSRERRDSKGRFAGSYEAFWRASRKAYMRQARYRRRRLLIVTTVVLAGISAPFALVVAVIGVQIVHMGVTRVTDVFRWRKRAWKKGFDAYRSSYQSGRW